MNDIVRMLRVSESDPVQQEAADEIERLEAERDALRAELAAEREAHEILLSERNMRHFQMTKAVRTERDALRALLREALAHLKTGQWTVPTDITLMSRIDATLSKGGGNE